VRSLICLLRDVVMKALPSLHAEQRAALAGLQTEGDKTSGEFVDLAAELSVGPANVLMANDEGFMVSEAFRYRVESRADSGLDQRRGGGATDVAHGDWHDRFPPRYFPGR
jgi:hypothetical protein